MRSRSGPRPDAVARRLELLSRELAAGGLAAEPAPDLHTHVRPEGLDVETGELVAAVPVPGRHAARRRPSVLSDAWASRIALGPGPVAVLAVVVALGLAFCCWWLLRADAEPVAATTVHPGLATPVPVGSATAAPPTEIVVDVAGKVRRPGIAVLAPGDRVVDALRAAGGPRRGVDLSQLNLARLLVDGEQILVGVAAPPGVAASAAGDPSGQGGGALVNLNTATPGQLEELPGVGPVTAEAIVAFRTEHGAFTSVEELLDVSGIGEATLAEIAPHATV